MRDAIWKRHLIKWKDRTTWSPLITEWIDARLRCDIPAIKAEAAADMDLGRYNHAKWLDMLLDYQTENVIADLSQAIKSASMRLYHATRVEDATCFHVDGLRLQPRSQLVKQAAALVNNSERLRPLLPYVGSIKSDIKRSRDKGRTFTCIDDRPLINDSTHYAMYGPEWITAHLVSLVDLFKVGVTHFDVYDALRDHGVPTILVIDLPLILLEDDERQIIIRDDLLPDWIAEFLLGDSDTAEGQGCPIVRRKIPGKYIVKHYHPAVLKDPYNRMIPRSCWATTCASCAAPSP